MLLVSGLTGGYWVSYEEIDGRLECTDEVTGFYQPCLIPCLAMWLLGAGKAYGSVDFTAYCTRMRALKIVGLDWCDTRA